MPRRVLRRCESFAAELAEGISGSHDAQVVRSALAGGSSTCSLRQARSLDRLQELLNEDCTALAGRLLAELEVALAARIRFRHHFLRTIDDAATQALRLMVREHSWDGAVDHDCQIAIELQSGRP